MTNSLIISKNYVNYLYYFITKNITKRLQLTNLRLRFSILMILKNYAIYYSSFRRLPYSLHLPSIFQPGGVFSSSINSRYHKASPISVSAGMGMWPCVPRFSSTIGLLRRQHSWRLNIRLYSRPLWQNSGVGCV